MIDRGLLIFTLLTMAAATFLATGFYLNLEEGELERGPTLIREKTIKSDLYLPETTLSLSDLENEDPSLGEGAVTLIEFFDYDCSGCEEHHNNVHPMIKSNYIDTGKIKFIHRDFVTFSKKAEAPKCAQDQGKYWEYNDKLFRNLRGNIDEENLKEFAFGLGMNMEQFEACLESGEKRDKVQRGMGVGKKIGIKTIPSFVIVGHEENMNVGELTDLIQIASLNEDYEIFENPGDGIILIKITGVQPYEIFQRIIDIML